MEKLLVSSGSKLNKAKIIFAFVRDNFKASGQGVLLSNGATLEDIFKKQKGGVADINLLLIAMLRYEHIDADPVILSTKKNGLPNNVYPILENYNYLICKISVDSNSYYLDASRPKIGFGKLPVYCYNGQARVITTNNYATFLAPDSLTETKTTEISINKGDNDTMIADYKINPGYYESLDIRASEDPKPLNEYLKEELKKISFETEMVDSGRINSMEQYDSTVEIHCKIKFKWDNTDLVYFNPMMNEVIKDNPFKSTERLYPIELPYKKNETYVLNMEIPKGYEVEEIPKPAMLKLNDDGFFVYEISLSANHILLKSSIVYKKAIFDPKDYNALRDFLAFIIKKQNEMIVFKKKKLG